MSLHGFETRMKRIARLLLRTFVAFPASKLFPAVYNKWICSRERLWSDYFPAVEVLMNKHWEQTIWPLIRGYDFDTVLELAPGAGRNTQLLAKVARVIHAVDLNEYALVELRSRFRAFPGTCELHVHRNHGSDLDMIPAASISLIYCWDAAVHFDKAVLHAYINEFARVLMPGGVGFIHHSNLGTKAHADIRDNAHWRSNMSKELFAQYCGINGLQLLRQVDLPWNGPDGDIIDCISLFRKP